MGEVIYKAVIPFDPKTKKNNMEVAYKKMGGKNAVYKFINGSFRMLGVPFITQGEIFKQYQRDCGYWLRRPKEGPINEPVNICFLFYRGSKRQVDLCNLQNAILDILTHYHIITDDNRNIVYSMDGSRVFYDKEKPRTEIIITRAEDGKKWGHSRKEIRDYDT